MQFIGVVYIYFILFYCVINLQNILIFYDWSFLFLPPSPIDPGTSSSAFYLRNLTTLGIPYK